MMRRNPLRGEGLVLALLTLAAGALVAPGCSIGEPGAAPGAAPPPSYTGPAFLRGTVGSMCYLRHDNPLFVSRYGVVVNLNGTGSQQVPAGLRQRLINEMRKQKVGSPSATDPLMRAMSPERLLADPNTAVVEVVGMIPPGAQPGSRFDVLVDKWPQTETTSLAGGVLWSTELMEGGADVRTGFMRPQATARGPIYIHPAQRSTGPNADFNERAMVVAGGKVTEPRIIELVLNQPGFQRCRTIADRINDRFGRVDDDKPIAEAKSDVMMRIHVPPRHAADPAELLSLISYMHVQAGKGFEDFQARRFAEILAEQPDTAEDVVWSWKAMGRSALPAIREQYETAAPHVRLSALEAGAYLGDERASEFLKAMADDADADVRRRVAEALVHLPRSLRGASALKSLLNDPDTAVRLAAYESLSAIGDPQIDQLAVTDPAVGTKFIIERVKVDRPMIYITQDRIPRVVIFNEDLGFESPSIARVWDNRLMVRMRGEDRPMEVFYQSPREDEPKTFDNVYPSVATLAFLLGHRPTLEVPQEGLDLSYSEVVDALYQMCEGGQIAAPIEFNLSPLQRLLQEQQQQRPDSRPEFEQADAETDAEAEEQPLVQAGP